MGRILLDVLASFPVCDLAILEEIAWHHCLLRLPCARTWYFLALPQYSKFSTREERSRIDKEELCNLISERVHHEEIQLVLWLADPSHFDSFLLVAVEGLLGLFVDVEPVISC